MDRLQILPQPLSDSKAAAAILEHFERSQAAVSETLKTAALACESALRCGELLLEMREKKRGEFLLWCKCYVPAISESTARRYMRISQLRRSMADSPIDLQTLRQYYQLLGIMPPRGETQRQNGSQVLNFWSFATKLNNWMPSLPEEQLPRVRAWWTEFGKSQGWI